MAQRQSRVLGPDGISRTPAQEDELNELAVAVFGRGGGREFLRYLRSITIEMVAGPEITAEQLRHREGSRYLVGIIESRLTAGQNKRRKNNATKSA